MFSVPLRPMPTRRLFSALLLLAILVLPASYAQSPKIYWGDEVPKGWNGRWPAKFLTVPEKTGFTRTTSTLQLHEFVDVLQVEQRERPRLQRLHERDREIGARHRPRQSARDVAAAGEGLGQAGHLPAGQHPPARVRGGGGAADGDARHPLRQPASTCSTTRSSSSAPSSTWTAPTRSSRRTARRTSPGSATNAGGFDLNRDAREAARRRRCAGCIRTC